LKADIVGIPHRDSAYLKAEIGPNERVGQPVDPSTGKPSSIVTRNCCHGEYGF
jgi:hypothetical protein